MDSDTQDETTDPFHVSDDESTDPTFVPDHNNEFNTRKRYHYHCDDASSTSSQTSVMTGASTSSAATTVSEIPEKLQKYKYLDGKFFKIVTFDEKSEKVATVCQLCLPKKAIVKGFANVSSNFLRHITRIHPNEIKNYKLYKQEKMANPTCGVRALNTTKKQTKLDMYTRQGLVNQKTFNNRVLNFIVTTMSPPSIVQNDSFKAMFDGMNVKVMSRYTLVRQMSTAHNELVVKIQQQLSTVNFVCTTADVWSAKTRSFFGMTCHWIEEDTLKRRSAVLGCKRFPGTHSYDRVGEMIDEIHLKFNLNNRKVIATVTDNGSNFVKAFKEFGIKKSTMLPSTTDKTETEELIGSDSSESESDEEIDFYDLTGISETHYLPWHLRCASHTMSLIVTTDCKNVIEKNQAYRTRHTNAVGKCSSLWNKANRPKSAEIIKNVLGHTLSYPVITRWNSFYDAISQIVTEKEKLGLLFEKLEIKNAFKENELLYLEEYCLILRPIAATLDILQGEENMFFGYLLPSLVTLKIKLEKIGASNFLIYAKHIHSACVDGLMKRFHAYFNLLPEMNVEEAIIASFSHPQFKLRWVAPLKSITDRADNNLIQNLIIEKIEGLQLLESVSATAPSQTFNTTDTFFDFGENSSTTYTSGQTKNDKIKLEMLHYLEDSSSDLNMLKRYPSIAKVFIRFNTALPSSASVERLFSYATIINAPRRNALSDKNFEALVMLKGNSGFINLDT